MPDQNIPLASMLTAAGGVPVSAAPAAQTLAEALLQGDPMTNEAVRQELYRRGVNKLKIPYQIGFPSLLMDAQQRQGRSILDAVPRNAQQ